MKNAVILLLLLSITHAFSQKKDKPQEYPWDIAHTLYTSDSTGIADLAYGSDKSGIAFVRQDGTAEKELAIPGCSFGMGKWKGNILCFYTDNFENKLRKEVHAVLVDAKTKTIISDKLIYTNPTNNQLEFSIGNDKDGNFGCLLVRISEYKGNPGRTIGGSENKKLQNTTALTAIFLSDQLEPTLKQLSSAAVGGQFFNNFIDSKGQLIIVSYAADQLVAEKFDKNGQLLKKLAAPVDYFQTDFDWDDSFRGQLDPENDNLLSFSMAHLPKRGRKSHLSLFVFDFATGQIPLQESTELNKDYFRQFKDNPDLVKAKHFKMVENLKPDNIIFWKDKLIVFNEIRYNYSASYSNGSSGATRFDSEGVIVSFYDKQYHLVHQLFLDRYYECFFNIGRGLSYCLRDGKILAFGNELAHVASYGSFCYVIDPETYQLERKLPEWGEAPRMAPVDINHIFWFRNSIITSHEASTEFFGYHTHNYLVKVDY